MIISYLNPEDCIKRCFPYIREKLQGFETAPNYQEDTEGMSKLNSVLFFVRNDEHYKSFSEKAAYLFCSIAQQHAFGNGNKRLATTLLRYFLQENNVKTVEVDAKDWKDVTIDMFPDYVWKDFKMEDSFYLFLYNLAFIAADGQLRPGVSFENLKEIITAIFERIFELPDNN